MSCDVMQRIAERAEKDDGTTLPDDLATHNCKGPKRSFRLGPLLLRTTLSCGYLAALTM